jgi:hypothetical protein
VQNTQQTSLTRQHACNAQSHYIFPYRRCCSDLLLAFSCFSPGMHLCRCSPFFTTSTPTWLRRIRRFALTSAGATLASRRTPLFPTRQALSPLRTASCRMNSTLFSTPCPRLSPPQRWVAGAWTTNNCQSVSDVYKIRQ